MTVTAFLPVEASDYSWKVNDGYNTESHTFFTFLPNGSLVLCHLNYVKISFVTVVKASIFTSIDGVTSLAVNSCSDFKLSDDKFNVTCDKLSIKYLEKDIIELKLHPGLGAEGTIKFQFPGGAKKLDPASHVDDTIKFVLSSPAKVSGQIKVGKSNLSLDEATGYHLHSVYPDRFDGIYKHSYLTFFDSETYKIAAIFHQPRSQSAPSLIQQIYIHSESTGSICTAEATLELKDLYQDPKTHHQLPKTIDLSVSLPNSQVLTIKAEGLNSQSRIDALEQLPYLARKVVSKFLSSPCFYLHHAKATLKLESDEASNSSSTEISGQFFFELAQF